MSQLNNNDTTLRIALPKKGRIADELGPLFKEAGYDWSISETDRTLFAKLSNNIEAMFVRTKDVATVVADGVVDIGITGTDIVEESQSNVQLIEKLPIFSCRLVLAAQSQWRDDYLNTVPKKIRIATSFPNLANQWGREKGIEIDVVPLSGSVEIAPKLSIADAIIDLTQSGATLRSNGLVEVETIKDVGACVIASPEIDLNQDNEKSNEAKIFCEVLTSVINARGKRYLMMNVPKEVLEEVKEIVPGMSSPTVIDLYGKDDIVAIHTVIEAKYLNSTIAKLRNLGVQAILVSHIERLIP
ncbi:MAG: ATP phosphoribosyltransferase [Acidimicrobiia bacterium]